MHLPDCEILLVVILLYDSMIIAAVQTLFFMRETRHGHQRYYLSCMIAQKMWSFAYGNSHTNFRTVKSHLTAAITSLQQCECFFLQMTCYSKAEDGSFSFPQHNLLYCFGYLSQSTWKQSEEKEYSLTTKQPCTVCHLQKSIWIASCLISAIFVEARTFRSTCCEPPHWCCWWAHSLGIENLVPVPSANIAM